MSVYLTDYENVHVHGLEGLEGLGEKDKLVIFYSESCNTISFQLHEQIIKQKLNVEYYKVTASTKNSLDFQLVSYLGYLIAKEPEEEYVIISNDEGFRSCMEFWKHKKVKVLISSNIKNSKMKDWSKELMQLLPEEKENHKDIISCINQSHKKQELNNFLVKKFGSQKAGAIYKVLKTIY